MTLPRPHRRFGTLCSRLFFAFPGMANFVLVSSVAGLVATLVEFAFPGYLLGSLYDAVAYHYPRVIIFYVPFFIVQWMNTFPVVSIDRLFLVAHASVVVIMAALAAISTYSENMTAWKVLEPKVDVRSWNRTQNAELTDKESSEGQGRVEPHERIATEHGEEVQHLLDERKSEQAKAARTLLFKALAMVQRREEHQAFVYAKENERLTTAINSTIKAREAVTAAHRSDLQRWEQQRVIDEAKYVNLQGSLDLVTAEHRSHMKPCERDLQSKQKQLTERDAVLERVHKTHATQLAATYRHHERQTLALEATNDCIIDCLVSVNAANDAIASSYKAHVEHTKRQLSMHEAQYTTLQGSLAQATAKHRIHMENYDNERAQRKSRVAELLARLDVERAARTELQFAHDGLKSRHATASQRRMAVEAKLKTAELELYLQKHQDHPTLASQDISDTLINSPVVQKHQYKRCPVGRPETHVKQP